MTDEIKREGFLRTLESLRSQDAIKVITGMRRCGKSTLLRQFIEQLKDEGVPEDRIVYVNMELISNDRYRDGRTLYNEITSISEIGRLYIFIDEIQMITGWERVVNSLAVERDCDIYITGSNAYLLSTEISTYLTGRSISLRVLPLSLGEYVQGYAPDDLMGLVGLYQRYTRLGGMPFIRPEMTDEMVFQRLDEIKSDIILKDICNRRKVDAQKVRRVIDYLFSEIGNPISSENIAKGLGISSSTASDYLSLIMDSLLFSKVERYDLRGRSILKTEGKIYCTDLGMRNTQPIPANRDPGRIMENMVYLELIRRGYKVSVGKIGNYEIDFVAAKGERREFYQVALTVADPKKMEDELRPFRLLRATGDRYLITGDPTVRYVTDEAIIVNIIDFLTSRYRRKQASMELRYNNGDPHIEGGEDFIPWFQ